MTHWLLAGTLIALLSAPAAAQTAGDKFVRGFAALTTPFLEVPGNMVRETDRRGAAEGIPLGFAKGLGMIVPRILVGVWEFLTAPFPVPAGYQPILEPEYPWSYFETRGAAPPPRARQGVGTPAA
jgi:putative exosortase-associated protein (TIGR04073 family)